MVLPCDAQTSSEVAQVNSIQPAFLAGVEDPCFAAAQQCAEHAASIHLHLGVIARSEWDCATPFLQGEPLLLLLC